MEPTVIFRDFEERDIDFIYHCKNDEKLNSMIVGQYHPFTYEEATEWVHGCMGEHETYKFWAIATNDEEKRIVGWISLSCIDYQNKSACFHGLVIGDSSFKDGSAWIESYIYILNYFFVTMAFNRLYGTYLPNHIMTKSMANSVFFCTEGIYRQSHVKNGIYYDEVFASLLASEYFEHLNKGDFDYNSILKRLIKELKNNRK